MLYCILAKEQYNLAYFFSKRIESTKDIPTANLPCDMFLTRLFRYVIEHYPHLNNGIYNVVDRVMRPLALKQTRKPQSDHGMPKFCQSVSSSYVIEHYPHLNNGIYNVVDRVMRPLALKQTRKPQSDHGMPKFCHSVSSSSAHHFGSSSYYESDEEDKGTSQARTLSPTTYLNSLRPLTQQTYNIPMATK
nr:hypothetical protein [Tanacetum cinerariifolium]